MSISKMNLPDNIKQYMKIINDEGYECYLVGGAVRDNILNVKNKDYDFCTNMPLDKLKKVIPNLNIMKENQHRNTAIIRDKEYDIEFTTFRGLNLKEDLSNRDFTMNALAVDVEGNLIDYFNGIDAINNKTLTLVKENGIGLDIDPLRILRAIRQALKYKFKIDENTKNLMITKRNKLNDVACERIYDELKKILVFDNIDYYLNEYKEIFFEIIPELQECDGFNQHNDYHVYDVYAHIINVVKNTQNNLYVRLAALFHDIGKPEKYMLDENGVGHFLNHASVSNQIFRKFANKYKIDNKTKKIVSSLILYHEDILSNKNNKIYNFYKKFNMNQIEMLFDLKRADIIAQNPKYIDRLEKLDKLEDKYISIRDKINRVKYTGNDVIILGFKGSIIKDILDDVKRQIINGQLELNKKDIDNYIIKKYLKE